jgi:hypothetical protein
MAVAAVLACARNYLGAQPAPVTCTSSPRACTVPLCRATKERGILVPLGPPFRHPKKDLLKRAQSTSTASPSAKQAGALLAALGSASRTERWDPIVRLVEGEYYAMPHLRFAPGPWDARPLCMCVTVAATGRKTPGASRWVVGTPSRAGVGTRRL